jgi:DNA-binding NarL/FixJ family response regulator
MVRFAAGHVRAGKLLGRSESRDVLSRFACEEGHCVTALPGSCHEDAPNTLASRIPGPAAEAITAMDWKAFLDTLTPKERALADGLAEGSRMAEIAQQRGVSKAAVGDMRNTLARKWSDFDRGR